MELYDVPAGSRPHDVAPAPDGSVWYTAQSKGALGILDPATGKIRHIPLGKNSAPHGVIAGPAGAAWITDGGLNAIVKYDPATEAITVYPLPANAGHGNLNTPAFGGDGKLWFTGQAGIYGSVDPATGQVAVYRSPGGRGPYGIASTPGGTVYYASLAGSYLGRINAADGSVEVLSPPTPNQGARRVWSDSKGVLWISEWKAGQLARYDPQSQQWREWKLPGKKPRAYAVYVDDQDIVWLSDFGANALVRFDPATEKFTSFPHTKSRAAVRQLLGRPGELWGAESGRDRLVVLRTD